MFVYCSLWLLWLSLVWHSLASVAHCVGDHFPRTSSICRSTWSFLPRLWDLMCQSTAPWMAEGRFWSFSHDCWNFYVGSSTSAFLKQKEVLSQVHRWAYPVLHTKKLPDIDQRNRSRLVPYQCALKRDDWMHVRSRFVECFLLQKTAYRRANGGSTAPRSLAWRVNH